MVDECAARFSASWFAVAAGALLAEHWQLGSRFSVDPRCMNVTRSVLYSDRRAVQAIGRIDRGADQNEGLNGTLAQRQQSPGSASTLESLDAPLPPSLQDHGGGCETGPTPCNLYTAAAVERGLYPIHGGGCETGPIPYSLHTAAAVERGLRPTARWRSRRALSPCGNTSSRQCRWTQKARKPSPKPPRTWGSSRSPSEAPTRCLTAPSPRCWLPQGAHCSEP